MPAKPFVPGVARVTMKGTQPGGSWACVFHVGWPATQTPLGGEAQTLADNFWTAFTANAIHGLSADMHVKECDVVDLSNDQGSGGVHSGDVPGGTVGAAAPPNLAVLVSWKINRRYRGGHPRTYLPSPSVNHVSETGAYSNQSGVQTDVNSFFNAVNAIPYSGGAGQTFDLVVPLFHFNKTTQLWELRSVAGISAGTVHARVATQRRRMPKP